MRALVKHFYLPLVLLVLAAVPGATVIHGLRTGALWRPGGLEPVVTLAKDAAEFYHTIIWLSALALVFLSSAVWTGITLFRHQTR